MKKILTLTTLIAAAALTGCNCPCCSSNDGFKEVFAPDLSNTVCKENVWSFKDGELQSTKDVILFTKEDYENFEAEFEFNIEKGSNGGFIFYVTSVDGDWTGKSLELQVCDTASMKDRPTWQCGAIFGHVKPEFDTSLPYGQWNKMRIVCKGQQIDAWLNGKHVSKINLADWKENKMGPDGTVIPQWLTAQKKCDMATKGRIGLQGKHGAANCKYRNVKIRQLSK